MVITEPTCTDAGQKEVYCLECGEIYDVQVIEPLGHIDNDNDGHCDFCCAKMRNDGACPLCGRVHEGFFGKIVYCIHHVLSLIRNFIRAVAPFLNVIFK